MLKLSLLFFICLANTGFYHPPSKGYSKLNADEFYIKLNSESDKIILDVREIWDFNSYHIPGAVSASDRQRLEILTSGLDREISFFVYCTENSRSKEVCRLLVKKGFRNIYMLTGGIERWEKRGFPIEENELNPEELL